MTLTSPDNPGPEQMEMTRCELMRDTDSNLAMNKDEKLEWYIRTHVYTYRYTTT